MNSLIPTMHGIIDRRMLINFRVKPAVVGKLLPSIFRPKLINGWAMAGICLIRLKEIRPRGFPGSFGLTSENAAHRIAVEWEDNSVKREGVFIPRRDTSSVLQSLAGGRVFTGVHHLADFEVRETGDSFFLHMRSRDDGAQVLVDAHLASQMTATSVFKSVGEASDFYARGSVGYSSTRAGNRWDGLELRTEGWRVEPLDVFTVKSSFFDDPRIFPAGTVEFDCGLLMRGIPHEWHVLPKMEKPA